MKLYTIIVGTGFDRDGYTILNGERTVTRSCIESLLLETYGGYTILESSGGWVNGSQLVKEPGLTILILVSDSTTEPGDVALTIARVARQSSVVLIHPNGEAEFIIDR